MKKKIGFVVILLAFLIAVYAKGSAKDVPMSSINKELKAKTDVETMKNCNNRQLLQFLELDYKNYTSYLYYKSKEALGVEEILVIKAKHADDLPALREVIEKRVSSQIKTFEGYGPKQVSLLKNSIITTQGRYLIYCVAKKPEKYKEVVEDVI